MTPVPTPTPQSVGNLLKSIQLELELESTPVPTPVIEKYLTPVPTPTPNYQKTESTPGMTPTPDSESPIFGQRFPLASAKEQPRRYFLLQHLTVNMRYPRHTTDYKETHGLVMISFGNRKANTETDTTKCIISQLHIR